MKRNASSKKTSKKTSSKKATQKKRSKSNAIKGNPKGPKTKYNRDVLNTIKEKASEGLPDYEICKFISIHPSTFCEWKATYPELSESLRESRQKKVEVVEAALYRSAMGYTHYEEKIFCNKYGDVTRVPYTKHYAPNPASIALFLRAYKPELYANKMELVTSEKESIDKGIDFVEFCDNAGYPIPYEKQVEMQEFTMYESGARLLLGARGYGKTDYAVILGCAFRLFKDKDFDILLVTKSDERNASILEEIAKALEANGVQLEKQNSRSLRIKGKKGKDHSVSAVTIGAKSIRGRHPKLIIMDDPVTEDDVSEATRKKVERLYFELNKLCDNICIIGQPVHKFDLYETLRPLLKKLEVKHGSIPELDHDLEAQRLAGVSEESIQASYFLNVVSESTSPFENVKYLDKFPKGDSVAFIDPSFEGGDYTALSIMKAHFDGVAVKGKLFKRAWYDCLDDIEKELSLCNVKRLCFEVNSLGEQPLIMLRKKLSNIGVVGKKTVSNKHSRIVNAGAFSHLIHIAKDSDKKYIEQVVKYEYRSKYDDAPDSLASCLEWIGLIRGNK